MQKVISDVADVVGSTLAKAKQRIADGRSEIKAYVASQPAALRRFASEAADKMSDQFDSLDNDVGSKQESVVSDLAQKYVAARQSVDDSITQMQEENKGLVQKAVDAVEAVVGIVLKMKDMLMNVLSRAANAIGGIIAHPIKFLENLVGAVKAGLSKFVANIGEHLKKGLLDWLLGALSNAGIELPENFDLKGILNLALSILGLTWASIRGRLVAKVGEPVMAKMEQAVDVFKIIATEGLGGLWNWIVDRVGDFKEMVMGEIREFISEKVIKAGIEWLIGILNPAAAFIKACEAIYNIVMFFVEKGKEIIEFVNSILDSVESILSGGVGAVADLIEGTLAKTIPLIINFLADLLGLGGISEKIKEIIGKIQAPINKAIDAVIGGALKIGKQLFAALIGKPKDKKVEDKRSPEDKQQAVNLGITESEEELGRPDATPGAVTAALPAIKARHQLSELRLVPVGPADYRVHAELNPRGDSKTRALTKKWSLAPGGFVAHEGQPFLDDDGVALVGRRGPILVHLIQQHVAIARLGVEQRVTGGGYRIATGFLSPDIMEKAVQHCLDNRQTEISDSLSRGETQTKVVCSTPFKCGYGYSVLIRQSQVQKDPPYRQRNAVEIAESDLASVTLIIRVSNPELAQFMVETAWPTPR